MEISMALDVSECSVFNRVRSSGMVLERHRNHAPPEMSGLDLRRHCLEKTINKRLVRKENGCIEWPGATSRLGYGMVRIHHKPMVVSRVVMEVSIGRILDRYEFVCHRCDNTRCVNIEHLFVGSQKDNMQDALKKGRMRGMFENGHNKRRLGAQDAIAKLEALC